MKVVVTCGPGSEPIDEVRRITNFSSGELGIILANRLAAAGHDVLCFKGSGATTPIPLEGGTKPVAFTNNEDLEEKLAAITNRDSVGAVFHVAALGDFKVGAVRDAEGNDLTCAKIPSRQSEVVLSLVPARKVLPELGKLFPFARIVGWKYELNGGRDDAVAAAVRQIRETRVDACVVNGRAYGTGFGFVLGEEVKRHTEGKRALADFLVQWLGG